MVLYRSRSMHPDESKGIGECDYRSIIYITCSANLVAVPQIYDIFIVLFCIVDGTKRF